MIEIYPAIDLRGGLVVRLRHGDPAQQTIFDGDPAAVAGRWAAAGATWLHIVNLNGALEEDGPAAAALGRLAALAAVGPRVQYGGGIRSLAAIEDALAAGAARVVLGTVAVREPALLAEAVRRFGPERVAVALDARDGLVRVRGWQEDSGLDAIALGRRARQAGVTIAVHTDIGRDGDLGGANGAASETLAQATGLRVIVSGGVAGLEDIRWLRDRPGIVGVVVGRALYEGKLELQEAIQAAAGPLPASP